MKNETTEKHEYKQHKEPLWANVIFIGLIAAFVIAMMTFGWFAGSFVEGLLGK